MTFTPSITLTPSATPIGVRFTVTGTSINVRSGPGLSYEVIGRLNRGQTVEVMGANADYSWWMIIYRQQQAWVQNLRNVLTVAGDRNSLPIVTPPPTATPRPTNTPTSTPAPEPRPDIILVSSTFNPPTPISGQPFTLAVVIRNQGTQAAGPFAIATSFEPGGVFSAQNLPGLAAGTETTVNLAGTVTGTGLFNIAIVLDLNSQLNESEAGKANNKPTVSYKVDKAYLATGSNQIAPSTNVDFGSGGTQDITYTGTNLNPINGAKVQILPGQQLAGVYWDMLSPATITNTAPIPQANLPVGTVLGMITAEGNRAVLTVTSYVGPNIVLQYFVYVP